MKKPLEDRDIWEITKPQIVEEPSTDIIPVKLVWVGKILYWVTEPYRNPIGPPVAYIEYYKDLDKYMYHVESVNILMSEKMGLCKTELKAKIEAIKIIKKRYKI